MIKASIYEGGEGSGRGSYLFDVLPSPGDRVVTGNNRGSCDVFIVDFVEHHPVVVPTPKAARPDPWVTIKVTYHSSFGD